MPFVPFKKKSAASAIMESEKNSKNKKKKKFSTAPSNKILTKNNLKSDATATES